MQLAQVNSIRRKFKSKGNKKSQTGKEVVAVEGGLNESELEEVAGGMQNQLNNQDIAAEHPGGANKTLDKNAAKVPIRCNAFGKGG